MKYKLSYYSIFTEPFEVDSTGQLKKQIAFSTRSSQALILSEDVCIKLLSNRIDDISPETQIQLKELKFIVPEEEIELNEIIDENKQMIANESLLYYVIQPSAFCQLGCDYCGQDHKKKNMSGQTIENVISRIKSKISLKNYNHLKIGWFGAEPLLGLKEIREFTPLLKDLADKNNLGYSAKIVTNGLSLKENIFLELTEKLYISQIEVTLDGIAEFHDKRRHTKESGATFDIIFNNLKKIIELPDFLEKKCAITLRCNVDERNFEGVSPLIKLLGENGFANKVGYFYPIGVYSWGNDAHKKSLSKEEFAEKEIDWLIEMYKYGFKPNLLPGRVKSVCLAVSPTAEMIDAYGNIFNCTEVSYVPAYYGSNYILGNVNQENKKNEIRPLSDWNDQILENGIQCSTCKMLPVCGGACPKSWAEGRRACPSTKFNIKEKLLLSYLATKDNFLELVEEI